MKEVHIQRVIDDRDLDRAFQLRRLVFIDEQGVSEEAEFDGLDHQCQHLLALIGEHAIGTLRLRQIDDRVAKIERVVVLKQERGRQVGARMMVAALNLANELGLATAKIHAQTYAENFYARLGFVPYGEVFDEDGLPHIAMQKDLVV